MLSLKTKQGFVCIINTRLTNNGDKISIKLTSVSLEWWGRDHTGQTDQV